MNERAADLGELTRHQRTGTERCGGKRRQSQLFKHRYFTPGRARPGETTALTPNQQILGHRHGWEKLGFLVYNGDPMPRIGARPWLSIDEDLAGIDPCLAGQNADHRALAGAIGAGNGQDLTGARGEIQTIKRLRFAVPLADTTQLKQHGGHVS